MYRDEKKVVSVEALRAWFDFDCQLEGFQILKTVFEELVTLRAENIILRELVNKEKL